MLSTKQIVSILLLFIFLALIFTVVRNSIFGVVDEEKHIYFEIAFLLLLAVAGELAVIHLKQPSVMILMILGILLSPSFMSYFWGFALDIVTALQLPIQLPVEPPHILRLEEIIHVFAQLGAVILLFKVGLHNKIEQIFAIDNLVVASLGVVVPFVVGFIFASFTGGSFAYSMFLGAALTATSVGVTVAILKDFGLLEKRFSQIIIGAAVIDDILSLIVLSLVINVSAGGDLIIPTLYTIVSAVVFIAGGVIAGNYFIQYLDRKAMSPRRFISVLAFMLLYSYLAEYIHLSAIVGAFIAGMVLTKSKHLSEIEDKTYGLELLFMPIFFISLGIMFDISALFNSMVPILIITILAVLSKVIPCALGGLLAKLPKKDSLVIGFGMVPRGEVALIVAAIGLSTNVIDSVQYSIISAVALLTTFIIPPILAHLLKSEKK